MSEEPTISSERIYDGRVVSLRVDLVALPGGGLTKREIVEHTGAVVMVALDDQDNILLVRQYRKPVERELLELPAGGLEPGESPEQCALRELREETGFTGRQVRHLGGFYSSPGFCTEYLHAFLVTDLVRSQATADSDESIALVRVPRQEIPHLVGRGEICDAKSLAALWLSKLVPRDT